MIQNMCVFKPVLQCVGSNIVHVLPVKSGGRGSFCQPVHCACVKMTSRVGKHETSYVSVSVSARYCIPQCVRLIAGGGGVDWAESTTGYTFRESGGNSDLEAIVTTNS